MSHHTYIIAEIGVNHQGSVAMARTLIHECARAGVDAVKFQTFRAENLVTVSADRAHYQQQNCGGNESQLDMLRHYELSAEDFELLKTECHKCKIDFLSSAFDMDSIAILHRLGMGTWKIPSGEITNLPYLEAIGAFGQKVILSTGMCTLQEVEEALIVLERSGTPRSQITLLQCTTDYPANPAEVNLRAMNSLRTLRCKSVGYSDHTQGIALPIAAVALGATVIEKHVTLSRSLHGPDHKASIEPNELCEMVRSIRMTENALGTDTKKPSNSEAPNRLVARKSIVASHNIKKGELLTYKNITVKRPGTGLSPMLWHSVSGTLAKRDFTTDELIEI